MAATDQTVPNGFTRRLFDVLGGPSWMEQFGSDSGVIPSSCNLLANVLAEDVHLARAELVGTTPKGLAIYYAEFDRRAPNAGSEISRCVRAAGDRLVRAAQQLEGNFVEIEPAGTFVDLANSTFTGWFPPASPMLTIESGLLGDAEPEQQPVTVLLFRGTDDERGAEASRLLPSLEQRGMKVTLTTLAEALRGNCKLLSFTYVRPMPLPLAIARFGTTRAAAAFISSRVAKGIQSDLSGRGAAMHAIP